MPEQTQLTGRRQGRFRFLFFSLISVGMFLLIAVASCTSSQTFGEIYDLVVEFLSLSKTSLSLSLRESPGLGHFLCYALLSLSLTGIFPARQKFLAPLLAAAFGVAMELVQIFIPSRDASLMDMGVNILGISLGFGLYQLWMNYERGAVKGREISKTQPCVVISPKE